MAGSVLSPIDPVWDTLDPTPDIHSLFAQFNDAYFYGEMCDVHLKWSNRLTSSAGVTNMDHHGRISVRLSSPILILRPRKDLVETLLHEMIHAYLFYIDDDDDGREHGRSFHYHMQRINKAAGTKITVDHDFDEECDYYTKHRWQCNGPCRRQSPHFGFISRSRDRSPGPRDSWWNDHQATCGGTFKKIYSPKRKRGCPRCRGRNKR